MRKHCEKRKADQKTDEDMSIQLSLVYLNMNRCISDVNNAVARLGKNDYEDCLRALAFAQQQLPTNFEFVRILHKKL